MKKVFLEVSYKFNLMRVSRSYMVLKRKIKENHIVQDLLKLCSCFLASGQSILRLCQI